ncbi:MAG TPA: hypothetical protein DD423_02685 [Opitutae bacterium]|jgi:hypothetical protein|nr:hypothetical protein [Opitutae bacterium]
MSSKIIALLSLAISALVFSGCSSASMGSKEANILGLVKYQKADYSPSSSTTFAIHTNELGPRRNFSGDKLTLLWGLVTIKDY